MEIGWIPNIENIDVYNSDIAALWRFNIEKFNKKYWRLFTVALWVQESDLDFEEIEMGYAREKHFQNKYAINSYDKDFVKEGTDIVPTHVLELFDPPAPIL